MSKLKPIRYVELSTIEAQDLIYERKRELLERTGGLSEGELRRRADMPKKKAKSD
ncbi:MAG: hypothetical protein KGH57_04100 [Candidatus Micrarchaeota archaeon]|nr:hypothetical protein [Candidatus Micrarchaeota archaeon]